MTPEDPPFPLPSRLPRLALLLGVAGLIPFIGCGLASVSLPAPQSDRLLIALIGYGAVILAFLGGVHWGFALISPTGVAQSRWAQTGRLALGVVPSLVGWLALLLPVVLPSEVGLIVLIAGFIAVLAVEARASQVQLVPKGYMSLRWGISTAVITVLILVAVLRIIDHRIIF